MAGLIPQLFIDELLNRTDIVELIDSYIPLKKQGGSYLACCPFHQEKTPSFNVIGKKQFYHCFGCGVSGNAISFLMAYLHLGFVETIQTLATRLGFEIPQVESIEKNKTSHSLYTLLNQVAAFYQQALRKTNSAITYLKQRGLNGEIARLYQLGFAPEGWHTLETWIKGRKEDLLASGMLIQKEDGSTYDRYRQRIMFPIHDRQGRIVGFGGRAVVADQKPKYVNSPETVIFQKSRELYGLYQLLQHDAHPENIILVEGYLDVIALAQHGIFNVAASLGTATNAYHIQLLSKYTKQLICCFDGDSAGKQAAWRALETSLPYLNQGLEVSFVFLPEASDPDNLVREEGREAFLKRIQNATPLSEYFFSTLTHNIDYTKMAGKTQLIQLIKPYLSNMEEGPYKQLILDELGRLTRMEAHRIQQYIGKQEHDTKPLTMDIKRSPERVAIALLLQHPGVYSALKDELPPTLLSTKDHPILQKLMQQIADYPHISTANLIEAWRSSSSFDSLNKLVVWEHQVPLHALAKEFKDTILFLAKQQEESRIQHLLQKARGTGLDSIERVQLQELLKKVKR